MTTKSGPSTVTQTGTSLAQLRDRILADPHLDPRRKEELASALRGLAKALRQPVEAISAEPADLRPLLANFTPVMAGLSTGRWRNIRSLVQSALAHAGLAKLPGRYQHALSEGWAALLAPLIQYSDRYKLGRLGRYCTAAGIEPEAVDDAVMASFLEDLTSGSLVAEPQRVCRDAIVAWNRGVAAHPDWPQRVLSVPDNRSTYAVPWTRLPPSLKADIDAWLDRLAGTDPFGEGDFRPLCPASLRTRARQIHEFISALVLRGLEPATLCCLAAVVVPERVAEGLRYFWQRAGDRPSVHGGQIAGLVRSIAKHWVGVGQPDLDRLKAMARRITPPPGGMTARNKARLRPLDDPRQLQNLLGLPNRIRTDVLRSGAPSRSLALQMQTAVMVELLIMAPMRIRNLAGLQIGVHLLRGRRGDMTLVLAEHEVKNRMPLEARLPAPTVRLLDLYLTTYRPLLEGADSTWLFPGRAVSAPKCCEGLRQQLQTCIWERCGLRFNPHLFRHAAGKVMLDRNPGAHGQVQRVLGHKTIATTLQYYSGMETKAAVEQYDAEVLHLRGEASTPVRHPRRKERV